MSQSHSVLSNNRVTIKSKLILSSLTLLGAANGLLKNTGLAKF